MMPILQVLEVPDKIQSLLCSKSEEDYQLAMGVCKEKYPFVWAAMQSYTGQLKDLNTEILRNIFCSPEINIGSKIRYRGMDQCPHMVVVNRVVKEIRNGLNNTGYTTVISAKYYNRSTQSFSMAEDRIECFETITEGGKTECKQ